jgi:hypothetical protein
MKEEKNVDNEGPFVAPPLLFIQVIVSKERETK